MANRLFATLSTSVLCLFALEANAFAGEGAVLYHTTVSSVTGAVSDGDLAALAVGDAVVVHFEVTTPGSTVGSGVRYTANLNRSRVEPPWARVFAVAAGSGSHVTLDSSGSGCFECQMDLPGPALLTSNLGSGVTCGSSTLSDYFGLRLAAPTGSILRIDEAGNSIVLDVIDICVYDPTDGSGTGSGTLGTNFCGPAVFNDSGFPAIMSASGSDVAADNFFVLECRQMTFNSFGYFLHSFNTGFTANPGGSLGNLCLDGTIGRFNRACGEVRNSGLTGIIELAVDLTDFPGPTGSFQVLPGDNFYFTCWFRDSFAGSPTSNFADGLNVLFQ